MAASEEDLRTVLLALTRIGDNLQRAKGKAMDPTRQAILQQAAEKGQVRPSEIAADLSVHQSSITRQTRTLEDAGIVAVVADPADGRSCLISLTEQGWAEVRGHVKNGIDRFATFVADWSEQDVRTLGELLTRLEESVAAVKAKERGPSGRRWQQPSS
jgi:DNA-binding MarR family transcriptional regulator